MNQASTPAMTRPTLSRRFSVAPMMDWTDRHCRFFLRQLSRHTLLYTEMVTTGALLHGDRQRFLRYDECEHPLALQLGGSVPARIGGLRAAGGRGRLRRGQPQRRLPQRPGPAQHDRRLPDGAPGAGGGLREGDAGCGGDSGDGEAPHRYQRARQLCPNSAISSARCARPAAGASRCMRGSPSSKGSRPRKTARCRRCATRSRRN